MQNLKFGKDTFFVWGKALGFVLGAFFMYFATRGQLLVAIGMMVLSTVFTLTAMYFGRREKPKPVVGGI